jgi:hypothetical protein
MTEAIAEENQPLLRLEEVRVLSLMAVSASDHVQGRSDFRLSYYSYDQSRTGSSSLDTSVILNVAAGRNGMVLSMYQTFIPKTLLS